MSDQATETPVAVEKELELDMDDVVIIFKMARLSTVYNPKFILSRKWSQAFRRVRTFLQKTKQIPS